MTGPARITIELEPAAGVHGEWAARTWVDESPDAPGPATAVHPEELFSPEARETSVVPAPYEPPAECTCVEGYCDVDHANE